MSNDKPTPSAEPSNGGAKPGQHTLTAEQRLAINDHLVQVVSSWAKWLGIANVAYLVTSLGYVFFVLPNQAVVEAQKIMEAHIDAQTTLINQKMHTILESYGQATERYEALNKQAVELKARIVELGVEADRLGSNLGRIGGSDAAKVGATLAEIEKYSQANNILQRLSDRVVVASTGEARLMFSTRKDNHPIEPLIGMSETKYSIPLSIPPEAKIKALWFILYRGNEFLSRVGVIDLTSDQYNRVELHLQKVGDPDALVELYLRVFCAYVD